MLASALAAFAILSASEAEAQDNGQSPAFGAAPAAPQQRAAPPPFSVVDLRSQGLEAARLFAKTRSGQNQIVVLVKGDDPTLFQECVEGLTAVYETSRTNVTLVRGDAVLRNADVRSARSPDDLGYGVPERVEIYGEGQIQIALAGTSQTRALTSLLASDAYDDHVVAENAAPAPVN